MRREFVGSCRAGFSPLRLQGRAEMKGSGLKAALQ